MTYDVSYFKKASVLLVLIVLVGIGLFAWFSTEIQPSFAAPGVPPEPPSTEGHQAIFSPNEPLDTPTPTPTLRCAPYFEAVYSPNATPGHNYLYAVAALLANDIWAVGYYTDANTSNFHTLTLHWNGQHWAIIPGPNNEQRTVLVGIAAISSNDVWAVGSQSPSPIEGSYATSLHWNGSQWSVVPVPAPTNSPATYLGGLTAISANDMWAVGTYKLGSEWRTFIIHWDGNAWNIVASPNPFEEQDSSLARVVAVLSNNVWAVGSSLHPTGIADTVLIEHWDGTQWTIVPGQNFEGRDAYLDSITAVSANDIWAAGYVMGPTGRQTLIEHWSGTQWNVVSSPNVGPNDNTLTGITAVSSNDIWAVGTNIEPIAGSTRSQSLLMHWNGQNWTLAPISTFNPNNKSLSDIVDVSAGNVWAIGKDATSSLYETLTLRWNGSEWRVVSSPSAGVSSNNLFGVAAISATDIWAVGGESAGTLIEHWDGSEWSIVPSPSTPTKTDILWAVAGRAPNDVWAVGSYIRGGHTYSHGTLVEHSNGSQWTIVSSPNPAPSNDNILSAISIISANDIWAVGEAGSQTLIEHWDGQAWSAVLSPNPAGSGYNPLFGISAISANDIWAVGDSYFNGYFQTLTLHWNGTQWAIVPSPNPGGPTRYNLLRAVAAISANDVWAVGEYETIGGLIRIQPLAMHWDGTQWNNLPMPIPNTIGYDELFSVLALSSDNIWAVGAYGNGYAATRIEHWDGTAWHNVVGHDPPDWGENSLWATAATSTNEIWAVGYSGGTVLRQTLVERYNDTCLNLTPVPTPIPRSPTPGPTFTPGPTPRCTGERFSDVCWNDYFYTAVMYLANHGVISGYSDGAFLPYNSTTRGQLSKIIVLAVGWNIDCPSNGHFSDVPTTSPFYCFVETAYSHGIISGYTDGTFRPGSEVTRGQLCKIIVLAQQWTPYLPPTPTFVDVSAGSPFYPFVETAYHRNIISGYGCGNGCLEFRPGNNATRGQICKIVYQAITNRADGKSGIGLMVMPLMPMEPQSAI